MSLLLLLRLFRLPTPAQTSTKLTKKKIQLIGRNSRISDELLETHIYHFYLSGEASWIQSQFLSRVSLLSRRLSGSTGFLRAAEKGGSLLPKLGRNLRVRMQSSSRLLFLGLKMLTQHQSWAVHKLRLIVVKNRGRELLRLQLRLDG